MKLKKEDSLNYRCDKCGNYITHKDMFDNRICYNCYDKLKVIEVRDYEEKRI
jgi:hypothetical protein